ncbi:MAG: DUF3327 domain-containing protein [Acidobacteriia bacterium]|nr:DUF3327 domain-containing protein [Terriglobia bacterium]MYG01118.1 DUF3327 domain-containing protein [Terriglobia bacterium]MYK11652.1 DUF3327 domain-containing protein [Terriglobia bacterium]
MNGSGGPRSMLRFEDLAPTVTASLMCMLLASCELGTTIPTQELNPSSLQAPFAIRPASPRASPRIRLLQRSIEAGEPAAATRFWKEIEQQGTPLIERIPDDRQHSLVTFLWRAADDTRNVAVVGEVINGAEPAKNRMFRVEGSDVWHLSFAIRDDARFTYAFSPNDSMLPLLDPARVSMDFREDPLNTRRFLGLSGKYSSYVELPDAPSQPWQAPAPDTARGRLARTSFQSALLGNERALWKYTPVAFDPKRRSYPLLVLLDGGAYTHSSTPAAAILDHLIATNQVPPTLAILVGNTQRARELPSSTFAAFLATELVPWAREKYGASQDPADIVIAGSSLGGLAASFTGFQHPDVFGNVLSMSGSYWWEWGHEEER